MFLVFVPYLVFWVGIFSFSAKIKSSVNLYEGKNKNADLILVVNPDEIDLFNYWISDREIKYNDKVYILNGLKYSGKTIIYYFCINYSNTSVFQLINNLFNENNAINKQFQGIIKIFTDFVNLFYFPIDIFNEFKVFENELNKFIYPNFDYKFLFYKEITNPPKF